MPRDFLRRLRDAFTSGLSNDGPRDQLSRWGIPAERLIERDGRTYSVSVRIASFEEPLRERVEILAGAYRDANLGWRSAGSIRREALEAARKTFEAFLDDLNPPAILAALARLEVGRASLQTYHLEDRPLRWQAEVGVELGATDRLTVEIRDGFRDSNLKDLEASDWSAFYRRPAASDRAIGLLAATPGGHVAASVDARQVLSVGTPFELAAGTPRWTMTLKSEPLALGLTTEERVLLVISKGLVVLDEGTIVDRLPAAEPGKAAAVFKDGRHLSFADGRDIHVFGLPDKQRLWRVARPCRRLAFQSGALVTVDPEVHVHDLDGFGTLRRREVHRTTRVVGRSIMGMAMDSDIEVEGDEDYCQAAWTGQTLLTINDDEVYHCDRGVIHGVSLDLLKAPPGRRPTRAHVHGCQRLVVDGGSLFSFHVEDVFVIDLEGEREPTLYPEATAVTAIAGGAIFGHRDGRITIQEF